MERKKGVVDKCRPISLSVTGRPRLIFAFLAELALEKAKTEGGRNRGTIDK
jgi:hypothetical protein